MKRHRVRLRPRAWRRRFMRIAAAALCMMLVVAIPRTVRRVSRSSLEIKAFFSGARVPLLPRLLYAARVETFEVAGVPESLAQTLRSATGWEPGMVMGPLKAYRMGGDLLKRYTCLREVRVRRSWLRHVLKLEATLRVPVARVTQEGREAGYLDDSGVLFEAPEGLWEDSLPEVDLGFGQGQPLKPLAHLLISASAPGALPARLKGLRLDDKDGWVGELEDRTRLFWGDLAWTEEKLSRLREVLADAAARFGKVYSADLRDFEDGRILVRPKQVPSHG